MSKMSSAQRMSPSSSTSMDMPGNMSHCAAEYAASLGNPFSGPETACIPDFPALMTGRRRVWAKGTFSTSTDPAASGFGFILADPFEATANDRNCVIVNAPASVTNVMIGDPTGLPALVSVFKSNSEYTASNYNIPGMQTRIVSAGLRIRYCGSELIRGGQVVGLHHPAHSNLDSYNITFLDQYKESGRFQVSRKSWTTLLYRPVDTDDLDFVRVLPVTWAAGTQTFYMGFAVQAADTSGANPQTFEFEFYVNYESQGAAISNKMPSHVDPVGHGAVNAITNIAPALHQPHTEDSTDVSKALVSAASHYIDKNTSDPHAEPAKKTGFDWMGLLKMAGPAIGAVASLF